MQRPTGNPTPSSPLRARQALEAHLAVVLQGQSLEEAGWERPEPLTLLIPVTGIQQDGTEDDYLLRLNFLYYPPWPPSTLFVNPETKAFAGASDARWLPRVEGTNEFNVHLAYTNIGQLVCCSFTLEFYQINHSVQPEHIWDPERQNFAATLNAVRWALRSPYYKGRQTA